MFFCFSYPLAEIDGDEWEGVSLFLFSGQNLSVYDQMGRVELKPNLINSLIENAATACDFVCLIS